MMETEPRGSHWILGHEWRLTAADMGAETVTWITNNSLDTGFYETVIPSARLPISFADLEALGYTPSLRYDGGETPPMVIFHPPYSRGRSYALAPATGRFYELEGV